LEAAEEAKEAAVGQTEAAGAHSREQFPRADLARYLDENCQRLRRAAEKHVALSPAIGGTLEDTAGRLAELLPLIESPAAIDLEDLERRLTVLEEKLHATLAAHASQEALLAIRREMDRALAPYRRKMTAPQLSQLERQYLQKRLFETYDAPRLSLFYMT